MDRGFQKGPLPKSYHTYATMMKLGKVVAYLKKIQKIDKSRDTSLEFCWHQHFFTRIQRFLLYLEIQMKISFQNLVSNSFNFVWVVKGCFKKHGCNFVDIGYFLKIGFFLKIEVFWNKGYDVIIFVHSITNKILSRESHYIIYVVMWPKFGNHFYESRCNNVNFYQDLTRKTNFFKRCSWFKFNNLGLRLDMGLKFYTSVAKVLKLKVRKL